MNTTTPPVHDRDAAPIREAARHAAADRAIESGDFGGERHREQTVAADEIHAGDGIDVIAERMDEADRLLADAASVVGSETGVADVPVSIVVPVYNEIRTIGEVLDRIVAVMPTGTEIVVVDDASTDGTSQYLATRHGDRGIRVFTRRRNHGKGSAVRLAIRHSRGAVVAIQDADTEYDPADLLPAIDRIARGDSDAVYGSRYLDNRSDGLLHRCLNGTLTWLSNRMTGQSLTDMETCHKAFRGDLVRSVPLRERRFGLEPEITARLSAAGVRIDEVPTGYNARGKADGKKIGWRDGVSALWCIARYRRSNA